MSRMRSEEVVPETNEDVDDGEFEYRAYIARANTVLEKYKNHHFTMRYFWSASDNRLGLLTERMPEAVALDV